MTDVLAIMLGFMVLCIVLSAYVLQTAVDDAGGDD